MTFNSYLPPNIVPSVAELLGDPKSSLNYAWAGVAMLVGLVIFKLVGSRDPYAPIPAVGSTGFILSYLNAIRFAIGAKTMLQEGYKKYNPGIFRVPTLIGWDIMVCGKKFIDELRNAPDDVLSVDEATIDMLAAKYTVGSDTVSDMYHISVTRNRLTRNIPLVLPHARDEMLHCFHEHIPTTDEWTSVKVLEGVMKTVSQISNRVFVGAPMCRDPEFIKLNIQFTIDVMIAAKLISTFPVFLRPLAGRCFPYVPRAIRVALKHLGPVIEERLRMVDEYGFDYPDKPNDMLSWLMDEAKGEQRSVRNLALRILIMNFAAIHTTSLTLTHAIYDLATHPEYIHPLREEVQAAVAESGWEKAAITRMRKLDSFLKESQRCNGISGVSLFRKALKDFTFSDGTVVPKGSLVFAAALGIHNDEENYPDPMSFDGFRFSNIREEEGESLKHQMVATSVSYLPFGHGRHACPGRFFAANELKMLLGHLVLNYDIKMAREGVRPPNRWFGPVCTPDPTAEVLFRKRSM